MLSLLTNQCKVMTPIPTDFTEYLKEKQEAREAALPVAVAQLQAIGKVIIDQLPDSVTAIEVTYYGGGDQGEMEEMRVLPLKEVPDGEPKTQYRRGTCVLNHAPSGDVQGFTAETYQPMKEVDHCDLPDKVTLTLPGEDEEEEYDVAEMIEEIAFEILENCHPGWEISDGEADGSRGCVYLDFPSLTVRLDHQAHYVATEDYEYEWEVAA